MSPKYKFTKRTKISGRIFEAGEPLVVARGRAIDKWGNEIPEISISILHALKCGGRIGLVREEQEIPAGFED